MTANEIRDEIMSMNFNDQRALMDALAHVAEKLCNFEHQIEVLNYGKADQPYTPSMANDFNSPL